MNLYYFKGPYKGDSFMVVSQSVEKALEYVKLTIAYSDESESTEEATMSEHENFIHDRYGWCYYDLTPGRIPLVYGLYVERDYRRQGHATRLLRMVTQAIRDTGYDGPIEVDARPSEGSVNRDVLVSFYARMGLTVRGGDHE